jgi:ribosomal protein S30
VSHFSLSRATQFGELGLRAITPKNLPKYLGRYTPDFKNIEKEKKKITLSIHNL